MDTHRFPHTFWGALQGGDTEPRRLEADIVGSTQAYPLLIAVFPGCHYKYILENVIWHKGQSGPLLTRGSEMQEAYGDLSAKIHISPSFLVCDLLIIMPFSRHCFQ